MAMTDISLHIFFPFLAPWLTAVPAYSITLFELVIQYPSEVPKFALRFAPGFQLFNSIMLFHPFHHHSMRGEKNLCSWFAVSRDYEGSECLDLYEMLFHGSPCNIVIKLMMI